MSPCLADLIDGDHCTRMLVEFWVIARTFSGGPDGAKGDSNVRVVYKVDTAVLDFTFYMYLLNGDHKISGVLQCSKISFI